MVGWGLHSHFHVQPNYCVEVVLCYRWGCDNEASKPDNFVVDVVVVVVVALLVVADHTIFSCNQLMLF